MFFICCTTFRLFQLCDKFMMSIEGVDDVFHENSNNDNNEFMKYELKKTMNLKHPWTTESERKIIIIFLVIIERSKLYTQPFLLWIMFLFYSSAFSLCCFFLFIWHKHTIYFLVLSHSRMAFYYLWSSY